MCDRRGAKRVAHDTYTRQVDTSPVGISFVRWTESFGFDISLSGGEEQELACSMLRHGVPYTTEGVPRRVNLFIF